jgi:6-phosphofructokinase 1
MNKKSLVYFQSGGPTTVINSSLLGVVSKKRSAIPEIDGIFGSMYGVEGLIEDNSDRSPRRRPKRSGALLKHTPGAILGSTRRKMPSIDDPLFDKIIWTIQKHNIGYMFSSTAATTRWIPATAFRQFFPRQKDARSGLRHP